ncbi:MAG: adenylate/guanylate cyclase domain-containing protein [Spirochaetaceae bacterium]|nr:MAG: adenylate/guanylate cyclase domain-containing protein [Spirochaetaceae bacterium]
MPSIDDLLRKRKELLDDIDKEIRSQYTRAVTLLFTDIVGSTQFFEEMGDISGRQMIQTHNDLLFPIIGEYGGRVIKTIGDSIMASFEDPCKAVTGAVVMQKALETYNKVSDQKHRIKVRMGLHFGEAVVDEKDLFGDMVNTSARVEARADAGEIIISHSLKNQLGDFGYPVVFLGTDVVKGKKEKIDFFMINWNSRDEREIVESWKTRITITITHEKSGAGKPHVIIRNNISLSPEIQPLAQKGNPYLNRVMLPHPRLFFGRQALVKRILTRIQSERPQSISIVGERRIGKSSLLNYLNFASTRALMMDSPEKYIFLFVDFQQIRANTAGEIIGVILRELKRTMAANMELEVPEDFDGMRILCQAIADAGYKFIMFFDEFESVTKNPNIKPDFYSSFRSLANKFPLAFVTASGRNLKDMCVTHEISDSPFFNIFSVQNVGLFKQEEAAELVKTPSAQCNVPLEPLASKIMAEAGLYPFFLQMMCGSWFEYLETEGKSASDFCGKKTPREVLGLFREEAEPHFEYIAETFSPAETSFMKKVAGETPVSDDDASSDMAAQELLKRGYLVLAEDGVIKAFGIEFGLFLKKYFLR